MRVTAIALIGALLSATSLSATTVDVKYRPLGAKKWTKATISTGSNGKIKIGQRAANQSKSLQLTQLTPAGTITSEEIRTWPIVITAAASSVVLLFVHNAAGKGKVTGIGGALTTIFAFWRDKKESALATTPSGQILEIQMTRRNRKNINSILLQ